MLNWMERLASCGLESVKLRTENNFHSGNRELLLMRRTKPATLRSISLDFVVKHITSVESFKGFPSEIGSEIFDLCVAEHFKDFSNLEEQERIVCLFKVD